MELKLDAVGKRYSGDFWTVRDFTLDLAPGVVGLLGPNGAGTSHLTRILATVTRPTEGAVTWNGADITTSPDDLRDVLGYLPQDFGVYPNLNAIEFLQYMAAAKGLDAAASRRRLDELLHLVNLTEAAKRPLGGYSGGMKQRVGIAQTILNDPQLLIVDETTVGLGPQERRGQRITLTAAGEDAVEAAAPYVVDVVRRIFHDTLAPEEIDTLVDLLTRVSKSARALLEQELTSA
jgi:ABC-2 type transport system ATP-binding protein